VLKMMAREYTPEWYLEKDLVESRQPASISIPLTYCGFPGETSEDFIQTMDLLAEVQYDCVFGFKYSARPNTPALVMIDSISEAEKANRLQVLLDRQREIQRVQLFEAFREIIEVMVEGQNVARPKIAGASSQNKPSISPGITHCTSAWELYSGQDNGHTSKQSVERRSNYQTSKGGAAWTLKSRFAGHDGPLNKYAIVMLKDVASESVMPIWVGIFEANAIAIENREDGRPAPMTHDLTRNMIRP